MNLLNHNMINMNTYHNINDDEMRVINLSDVNITSVASTVSSIAPEDSRDIGSDVYCTRCGRKLKDNQSRVLGMGPTCYQQFRASRNKQINLFKCAEM